MGMQVIPCAAAVPIRASHAIADLRGNAMTDWTLVEPQTLVPHRPTFAMSPRSSLTARMSQGKRRVYRGSWAEQRVVARLAINSTRNATRITTTPPTVSRSQRSELSRASNSRFPVITMVLISNSIEPVDNCSDQDHRQALSRPLAQKQSEHSTISPCPFIERRFA